MACKIRNLTDSAVQSAITNVVVKTAGKYKPEGTTLSIDTKDFSLEELTSIVEKWSIDTYKTAAFTNNWFTVNETPDKVVINFTAPYKLIKAYEVKLGIKSLDQVNNELMGLDEDVSLAQQPSTTIKPGVAELFESTPELANAVYSKLLTNSGLSAENLLSLLEKDNVVEKDCTGGGKLKAEAGIATLFEKGGKWEIVTDFKNVPTHKSGGKDISIQGKKVEVEKNELRIENDFGDVAVIPSKYRVEIKDAIKSNCHSCIDGIVESLPKMKDYAGDGTVFPFFGRYRRFKNSLPDNLKNTPESDYAMRYYWKHNNKPKSFDEAINREEPMFTMEDDGYYHAPSVEPNTLRFLKPKNHSTLQDELDWYNSDNPDAVDFRSRYDLDTSGKFYKYVPKK